MAKKPKKVRAGYRKVTRPDGGETTVRVGGTADRSYDSGGTHVGYNPSTGGTGPAKEAPKVKATYTSKGQKVTLYTDGTKTYGAKTGSSTTTPPDTPAGGITLPDLPNIGGEGVGGKIGLGTTGQDAGIDSLLGTSLPAVDSSKIKKDTKKEFSGLLSGIEKRFDTRIRDAKDDAGEQQKAYGGAMGTGRRFSSSAQAFLEYVDEKNSKAIADLEVQKEDAMSAGEMEIARLIETRIANERATQQQNFDNAVKAFDLLEKQNAKTQGKPEDIATSAKQAAIIEAMNTGLTDVEDIFNAVRGNRTDVTIEDITEAMLEIGENVTGKIDPKMADKLTGDAKNFIMMKSSFPEYLPTQISSLPESEQLSAYIQWVEGKGNVGKIGTSGATAGGGSVSNALPGTSGYDRDIMVSRIGKQIYGKNISNAESERVQSFINAGMKAGKSELQIMDDVLGFRINRNAPLAEKLRNSILTATDETGLAGFDMVGLARLINDGNDAQAVQKVEQYVTSKAKTLEDKDYVSESSVRYASQKADEVRDLVYKLGDIDLGDGLFSNEPDGEQEISDSIGNWTGTIQGWLGRFKSEEASAINTAIVGLVAEMRNKLSGTAVTESEKAFLEPLIPSLTDKPSVFLNKLAQLKSDPLLKLNTMRETYNLPKLDDESLNDYNKRVPEYMSTPKMSDDDFFNGPLPSGSGTSTGAYDPSVWDKAN